MSAPTIAPPVQSTRAAVPPPIESEDSAESIRLEHLKAEGALKTIGAYFIFAGLLMAFAPVIYLVGQFSGTDSAGTGKAPMILSMTAFITLIPILMIQTGFKLKQLSPSANSPAKILSILGLVFFPVGTVINLGLLVSLCSKKSNRILSDSYAKIVSETPQHASKVSRLFIIFAILLGVIIVLALLLLMAKVILEGKLMAG